LKGKDYELKICPINWYHYSYHIMQNKLSLCKISN